MQPFGLQRLLFLSRHRIVLHPFQYKRVPWRPADKKGQKTRVCMRLFVYVCQVLGITPTSENRARGQLCTSHDLRLFNLHYPCFRASDSVRYLTGIRSLISNSLSRRGVAFTLRGYVGAVVGTVGAVVGAVVGAPINYNRSGRFLVLGLPDKTPTKAFHRSYCKS